MENGQSQLEEVLVCLRNAAILLEAEGLEYSVAAVNNLIACIDSSGEINSSHKNGLCLILRSLLESCVYYDLKASLYLDKAYVLVKDALAENR